MPIESAQAHALQLQVEKCGSHERSGLGLLRLRTGKSMTDAGQRTAAVLETGGDRDGFSGLSVGVADERCMPSKHPVIVPC